MTNFAENLFFMQRFIPAHYSLNRKEGLEYGPFPGGEFT